MHLVPRDYQAEVIIKTVKALETNNKVVLALPTGAGKSIVIASLASTLPGRTLILAHRQEILKQNGEWIEDCLVVQASTKCKDLKPTKVVIGMVETIFSRFKKYGADYLGEFDNVISDECHIMVFDKVFQELDAKVSIGLTATPVINKNKLLVIEGREYTQPYTMSDYYDVLVQGVDTQDLIDKGYLNQDKVVELMPVGAAEILKDSDSTPDGFTRESIDELFSSTASLDILKNAYNTYGKGKKTVIFNANSKINLKVYEMFCEMEVPCMLYDSVNEQGTNPSTGKKWTREEVVAWFSEQKDAVLINVNVFTTGFNDKEIECVIVNRATKSLSLWLQIVGRGSRITDKIFKDSFWCIDLGGNVQRHSRWSERRDWNKYFYPPKPKLKRKMDVIKTWDCDSCGAMNVVGELTCSECGKERVVKQKKEASGTSGELVAAGKLPTPKGPKIVEYCFKRGLGKADAFNIMYDRILELFLFHNVSRERYVREKVAFDNRVTDIITRDCYGYINGSQLLSGKYRRKESIVNKMMSKIEEYYEQEI